MAAGKLILHAHGFRSKVLFNSRHLHLRVVRKITPLRIRRLASVSAFPLSRVEGTSNDQINGNETALLDR